MVRKIVLSLVLSSSLCVPIVASHDVVSSDGNTEKAFMFAREKFIEEAKLRFSDQSARLKSLGVGAATGVGVAALSSFVGGLFLGAGGISMVRVQRDLEFTFDAMFTHFGVTVASVFVSYFLAIFGGLASTTSAVLAYKHMMKKYARNIDCDITKEMMHNFDLYEGLMPALIMELAPLRDVHEKYQRLLEKDKARADAYLKTVAPDLIERIKIAVHRRYPDEFQKNQIASVLKTILFIGLLFVGWGITANLIEAGSLVEGGLITLAYSLLSGGGPPPGGGGGGLMRQLDPAVERAGLLFGDDDGDDVDFGLGGYDPGHNVDR